VKKFLLRWNPWGRHHVHIFPVFDFILRELSSVRTFKSCSSDSNFILGIPLNLNKYVNSLQIHIRAEIFTSAIVQNVVFWVVTPCSLESGYQRLGGTYCLHLQGQLNFDTEDGDCIFLRIPQSEHYRFMKNTVFLVVIPCSWREPEFSEEHIASMFRVKE
jgi:hypothetical protein